MASIVARRKLKVACVQFTATTDRKRNFEICSSLIKEAAKLGSKLICLPECFHFIGDAKTKSIDVAEEFNEAKNTFPSIEKYCNLANELKVGLYCEQAASLKPGTELINTPPWPKTRECK